MANTEKNVKIMQVGGKCVYRDSIQFKDGRLYQNLVNFSRIPFRAFSFTVAAISSKVSVV